MKLSPSQINDIKERVAVYHEHGYPSVANGLARAVPALLLHIKTLEAENARLRDAERIAELESKIGVCQPCTDTLAAVATIMGVDPSSYKDAKPPADAQKWSNEWCYPVEEKLAELATAKATELVTRIAALESAAAGMVSRDVAIRAMVAYHADRTATRNPYTAVFTRLCASEILNAEIARAEAEATTDRQEGTP